MRNDLLHHEYVQRHEEMLHEAERRRIARNVATKQGIGRHLIGRFGTFLIALGTKLERVEHPVHRGLAKFS